MRSRLRSLLLALVAFAIPVHGYAAAAMLVCGVRHNPAANAAAGPAVSEDMPCHGDGPLREVVPACDACAGCAALSVPAIASSAATSTSEKPPYLHVPFRVQRIALHVPAGPERPPRTLSR